MQRDIHRTRIHRILGADLGEIPRWICSHADSGLSFADLLPRAILAIGFGGCVALALSIGMWALPLAVLVLIATNLIGQEMAALKRIERKCKARLFRHECRYCGTSLDESSPAKDCDDCRALCEDCPSV